MNQMKKNKLLLQYIISYILVFLLPVIIFGWLMYGYVVKKYTEEILRKNMQLPYQFQTNFDMQLKQLRLFTLQAGIDPAFRNEYIKDNPYLFYLHIKQKMGEFVTMNSFIKQVFFWPYNSRIVYAPEGSYLPEILLLTLTLFLNEFHKSIYSKELRF